MDCAPRAVANIGRFRLFNELPSRADTEFLRLGYSDSNESTIGRAEGPVSIV